MRSRVGQFTASACNFVDWDNNGIGSPAIQLDAGKAIVQGCTFNRSKLDVLVHSNVVSAILTANQAEGGFRLKNFAGQKTLQALNQEDSIAWTKAARARYQITIGQRGDGRYLENWHDAEHAGRSARWSRERSKLLLPVTPHKRYTLSLEANIPPQSLSADAGVYLNGKLVAPLKSGSVISATLPASAAETLEVELRCQGWVPQKFISGSKDARTLGIQAFKITMQARGASARIFDANSGQWLAAQ